MNTLAVLQYGRVSYAAALDLQRRLVGHRKSGEIPDVLVLLEHTPVITLGRNARREHVLAPGDLLRHRGVELWECDRGGDVTFHGPGQLVGYPIVDLRAFTTPEGIRKTLGAVEYVRRLEEVLIRTCAESGVAAARIPGCTGVWTVPASGAETSASLSGRTEPAKIAAIGVHISGGITSHGFALNVSTNLDYFSLIVPCGLKGSRITSLELERGKTDMQEVAENVTRNFGRVFHRQILWVDTLDALLGRSVGVPVKPPEQERRVAGETETFWS